MREHEFRAWLSHDYVASHGGRLDARTVETQISVCQRVERYEGDLDEHFRRDGMRALFARLAYSMADLRAGRPLRHNIPLGGDLYKHTALCADRRLAVTFRATLVSSCVRMMTGRDRHRMSVYIAGRGREAHTEPKEGRGWRA